LRKLGATLLAVPVVIVVYLALAVRSAGRFRAAGFVGAAGLIALVLMIGGRPAPMAAAPQSLTRTVSAELLDTVKTGHGLKDAITIGFDSPMDAASVAAALTVSPDAAVSFAWDASGKTLTIKPVTAWSADTLYAVTVDTTAHAADGSPLGAAVHAVVMTAKAGTGSLAATKSVGKRVAVDTAFTLHLDRSVGVDAVQAAVTVDPETSGTVTAGDAQGDYVFTPDAPLANDTVYTITVSGLVDADGTPFSSITALSVRTVVADKAPSVVRFRPVDGATAQDRASVLSVRFTQAMNHKATADAFKVTANGKTVTGKITWAETSHVLIFTPSAALAYGAKVKMAVGTTAKSVAGVLIAAADTGTFTVKAKPVAKTTKPPSTKPIPHPGGSGGSGGVSASWYSVEVYYLNLMNCTRTGGWVTSKGACSSPGGRNVAPLKLSAGISTKVSRPYAKYLSVHALCNHFYQGTPGDRLRKAGYTSYNWAENIGCENISPYASVLGSHLFFQSEKPYNGGHYVNMMNSLYTECGIGVWVVSGRTRLVIDFYRP
jgi:uncharacterized protein YkwD